VINVAPFISWSFKAHWQLYVPPAVSFKRLLFYDVSVCFIQLPNPTFISALNELVLSTPFSNTLSLPQRERPSFKHIKNNRDTFSSVSLRVFILLRNKGEKLHDLYSSPTIVRVIKSRRMRWAGHVARMGEGRGVYRVVLGKPEGKRPLERPRRRWGVILRWIFKM
jgi:hypothetical protein